MDDDEIRALLTRLARPKRGGGHVIEGTAIRAEGSDFDAVEAWILSHGGKPEAPVAKAPSGGLHGDRFADSDARRNLATSRYELPPGALEA